MSRFKISMFAVACFVCIVGAMAPVWNHHLPTAAEAPIVVELVALAPAPSSPAPSTVHCVHKICADRQKWFRCVEWISGYREAPACARTEIDYEHHCDCDRWEE